MVKFQRPNPYNKFLPYASDLEDDADKYFDEIKHNFKQCLKVKLDLCQINKHVTNLQKYVALYGFRFSLQDHVWLIKLLYGFLTSDNVDPVSLDKYCKVLISLTKKKFLLSEANLILDWKPLYKLIYKYEDSSEASRGLIKVQTGLKLTLRTVIKFSRSYFSHESTQEMLDEWRPLLCPFDRCMLTGMKYLSLFLPSTSTIPPEKGWKLWFNEFMTLWRSFGNSPSWETELFHLYTRLAFHNTGRIDWTPYVESLFTKFMVAFGLPVTYGQSGVKVKFGLSDSSSFPYVSRWIVSALGGPEGKIVQKHLDKMLLAIESYFHPANHNVASEGLHSFVQHLCTSFVYRIHAERHNQKWETKTPVDKRLTDDDVEHFIKSLIPVTFHMLFNPFDEERRNVFNILSTIRPDLIIPPLLERLQSASESLTEPHRFTACLATLSACSRPFVENYPLDVIKILTVIVPGININDIWKSTDIFILMSDLLEMIWMIDFSHPTSRSGVRNSEVEDELLCQTALFDDCVLLFTDRCLTMLENSSREQVRHDVDLMEETLNDEELAADAAITETFQKLVSRLSMKNFNVILEKLKRYAQTHILEPAVAGSIFASMVKGVAVVQPELTLNFFIPHICSRIESILGDRYTVSEITRKVDPVLHFNLIMLSEIISVKMLSSLTSRPSQVLFKHIDKIYRVLDKTLILDLKDEYESASNALENLFFNIVHIRPLQNFYTSQENLVWSKEEFQWAKPYQLDDIKVDWYVPGKAELEIIQNLFEKYLKSQLIHLEQLVEGKVEMEKEEIIRSLRIIHKIIHGSSELMPAISTGPFESSLSKNLKSLEAIALTFKNGQPIRQSVLDCMKRVQNHLLTKTPDDTESLNGVVAVYDVLLFSFGLDEDELNDHMDEHRSVKLHRVNKMIQNKKHLWNIHMDRICIQHETHIWLKNFLVNETLPVQVLKDVYQLSVSHYSEVRSAAQELLFKIVNRVVPESQDMLIPFLAQSLKPDASHQEFKGALYILSMEKYGFFYSWKYASILFPALVQAQHSDKTSIVELLKDFSIKCNRSYSDFSLYSLPVKPAIMSVNTLKELGVENVMEVDELLEENQHFLTLESQLIELLQSGTLHWRHYQMAIGMLLTMMLADHQPTAKLMDMWMENLLHDDITIRFVAFQALECILKIYKLKKKRAHLDFTTKASTTTESIVPGLRSDNEWMQYKGDMTEEELEIYWEKPYNVKPELGFYAWAKPQTTLRVPDDTELTEPSFVRDKFLEFFKDPSKRDKYIELNSIENKKGEDTFSMDKALFYCSLTEELGPSFVTLLVPYVEKFVKSAEESEQRCAAEIMFGMIRGSRFWSYKPSSHLWKQVLIPSFKLVLTNITAETLVDWELCIAGGTKKTDPNRVRWLFQLLMEPGHLSCSSGEGAFKQSSFLKLLNESISYNWRARELYNQIFEHLKQQCNHPYTKVRLQISSMMATLLSIDIQYGDDNKHNMGPGCPKLRQFLDEVKPKLSLNFHNPVLMNGHVKQQNGVVYMDESSTNSTIMENFIFSSSCNYPEIATFSGKQVDGNGTASGHTSEQSPDNAKTKDHTLETVGIWIMQYIQATSTSLKKEMYELLPFLCQFVGNETGQQEVSQTCLKSLCYLSVCITPPNAIPFALEMIWKVAQSESWKAKMSSLEFAQTFVFTNFMSLCLHEDYVNKIESLVVSFMSDERLQVRSKAKKILCGLIHSGFIDPKGQSRLLKDFRTKIRRKMTKKVTGSFKFKKEKPKSLASLDKAELAAYHSGILGLSAMVEAYPYDVPEFVPDILIELEKHLHDPQPIPKTIKDTFQEFKRTHQDNWPEHKLKFTDDQLVVMTDLLVSPNYYA